MWSRNAFTRGSNSSGLSFRHRWVASTPALAAAVSNAGGLGGLGMWGFSAEDAERRIAGFRQQSGGSLNVNYPLWPEPSITRTFATWDSRTCPSWIPSARALVPFQARGPFENRSGLF